MTTKSIIDCESGSEVFLENGQSCELVAKVPGGFVLRPEFEPDAEGQPRFGDLFIASRIFSEPPVEKLHEQVKSIEEKIAKLNNENLVLLQKIAENKKIISNVEALTKKHVALQRIADFIDGKITHYVECHYKSVSIIKLEDCVAKTDYDRTKTFKLLTLYGNANGDLAWRLNYYKDGSGSETLVFPCMSEEEAKKIAFEQMNNLFDECRKNIDRYLSSDTIRSADMLGIPIPPDIIKYLNEKLLKSTRTSIISLEKQLEEAKLRESELKNSFAV